MRDRQGAVGLGQVARLALLNADVAGGLAYAGAGSRMAGTERTDIAASEARRLLGIAEISEHTLFTLARRELGEDRAAACLALARLAPLSRRSMATGAVAALIVGTRALGIRWWTSAHDERLRADGLETLEGVIADAAADAEWGAPIGFVDLNHPATDDRVKVPTGAKAGDRLIAAWDAGGRVGVRVVDRGGFLGSRLEEHWYHDGRRSRGRGRSRRTRGLSGCPGRSSASRAIRSRRRLTLRWRGDSSPGSRATR